MKTIHNIPMGKVKVGDIVQAKAGQPFGRVKSIERDGTDVVVTFRPGGTYYMPAEQRVTVDRPGAMSQVVDHP